jgi:PAS domain S-box-containing protein
MPASPPLIALTVTADQEVRAALGRTLRKAGFRVREAASGGEALRQAPDEVDVILLDLHLPDLSGFEVCCRLKAHAATSDIPVLHLSDTHIEAIEAVGHLEEGDEAYLTQPVDEAELIATIRALLRGRQLQQQFHSFLEAAPDAVVVVDQDGKIVRVNGQTEAMFGYGREELAGREVELLMPERFRERHRGQRAGFTARPCIRPMGQALELWGLRSDGSEFPVEISLSPLPSPGGLLVASVIRDVTQRKCLEQELREADRKKDEFLATLAHELRNPLATVRNAVEVVRLKAPPTAELVRAGDVIDRQTQLLSRLVDDLMDVYRIARGKVSFHPERVEFAAVVTRAAEASRPLIEACGHELTVTLPPQPVYLRADPVRLAQVFSNLLNNAAKYTEPGGKIRLSAVRQGDALVISVRDTGVGIPADVLPTVFDMFAQADRTLEKAHGGLGIGLSLVKGLVELHGGSVEARSEGPGLGSEFIVRLPALVPGPVPPSPTNSGPSKDLVKCRIVVADDSRDHADCLAAWLRTNGHEAETAYDGQDAVEAVARCKPEVVLLDIWMPRLNGYEACRRIRRQPGGEGVLIVALTGLGQDEDRRRSTEAGFDAHLVKPVDPAALMKLVAGLKEARLFTA